MEHYRSMGDDELIELAADFSDLTPTAQQVLRDEMRTRKLGDPQWNRATTETPRPGSQAGSGQGSVFDRLARSQGTRQAEMVTDGPQPESQPAGPVEYTWKTLLCDCEGDQEAWQICEMLRRAGIESWVEGAGTYANSSGSQHTVVDEGNRRVLVAADMLDQARAIAERPIPQDIVEQSRMGPADYEPPVCPKCGAADPILEDVDPVNAWRCEGCGARWSDASAGTDEGAEAGI